MWCWGCRVSVCCVEGFCGESGGIGGTVLAVVVKTTVSRAQCRGRWCWWLSRWWVRCRGLKMRGMWCQGIDSLVAVVSKVIVVKVVVSEVEV